MVIVKFFENIGYILMQNLSQRVKEIFDFGEKTGRFAHVLWARPEIPFYLSSVCKGFTLGKKGDISAFLLLYIDDNVMFTYYDLQMPVRMFT